MNASILLQLLWTGLATSTYLMLFAMAFAIVVKVNQVWNFAQAGMMSLGFFTMYVAFRAGVPTVLGVLLGCAVCVVFAVALERFGFQVLRQRNSAKLTYFIFTLIVSEFVAYLVSLQFGTEPVSLFPTIISPVRLVGEVVISNWDLTAFGLTACVLVALWWFMRHSREGQFLIAVAGNDELAELYGVSKKRAFMVAIAIAAVLATLGMYLYGTKAAPLPNTPLHLMVFAVIATILGGIGSIFGAAAAAVALGLIQVFSTLVIPSKWQAFLIYAFIFVVIILFPEGFRLPGKRRIAVRAAGEAVEDTGTAGVIEPGPETLDAKRR